MQIDIVSDTVCPWCFIGKRRLERALALRPNLSFAVNWRAFQLDPLVPRQGTDRKTYMQRKFGNSPQVKSMSGALRQAGAEEGISFDFDAIAMRPNTIDSHRLIRWSGAAGFQGEVVEGLFSAYFEQGLDIGDTDVLTMVAEKAGMDAALVSELLAGDSDRDLIEREDALAHQLGISGVPTFIFQNKFMLSGAQDSEAIVKVIDKVAEKMAEAQTEAEETSNS
jgi:predicted DsbA family dithiol-disulfide isomerase